MLPDRPIAHLFARQTLPLRSLEFFPPKDDAGVEALRETAVRAAKLGYAPYSRLLVGAAAVVDDGRVISGCNVENASYGLGLCAECALVGQLALTGGGRLVAVACRSGDGELLMPCGRCRQLLYEFGGPSLVVDTPSGLLPMTEVLPDAFGPEHLPR